MFGGAWELARLTTFALGLTSLETLLLATADLWFALALGGWLATFFALAIRSPITSSSSPTRKGENKKPTRDAAAQSDKSTALPGLFDHVSDLSENYRVPSVVWLFVALYIAIFTAMNWQLYRGLLLPHGDSAMYEEHLWNLTHGKGFRSYLDQGLFLGEHIQVVHLLLLPLYLLWPSQLLLELCQSTILAVGAIPVFWLARRHTGTRLAGICLAAAYLLYFPLQYLDIAIDLKTFRPNALGVPMVLFALDQLERRNYRAMGFWMLLTLSCQEDWAILLACLGVWIALRHAPSNGSSNPQSAIPNPQSDGDTRRSRSASWLLGGGIALFHAVYLIVATRIVILWFRDGKEIHYAGYFSKWGHGLTEIVWNMLTHPLMLYQELVTTETEVYLLVLLLPLAFLPLLSPGRLAVGLPVFVTLCLNELAGSRFPWHHFHAPVVPIVFWSAAAGLGNLSRVWRRVSQWLHPGGDETGLNFASTPSFRLACHAAWTCSLATGLFLGRSPLGVKFWDSGSESYWRTLYVPGKRAELFARVLEKIPRSARVASTDFVHPRFTHYERSYDYSDYPRAVSNYEAKVPDDTDYIVIDTQHSYSTIKKPEQLREWPEQSDKWELLPDDTEGYFIVLKRK